MTLSEFIREFDKPEAIVLLEGKRKVAEGDKDKLKALGRLLTSKTRHMIFRSGNAPGSDQYFSEGVSAVNAARLQVITPYDGHRKKSNLAHDTYSLESMNITEEPEVLYQSKRNTKTEKLIDRYAAGDINRFTIKAAYIIRDTVKAIGTQGIKPASCGIFYDDLENPKTGGTGHTMDICEENNIPVINQTVWFTWLTDEGSTVF
ncbi:hypothetical protein CYPRO_2118 [Cyclonatronum proteinivorum]|uniref:Uncharacterized protein n=1 Tax=Cyclonatronum proteinivorum TaxID=1457365 RepID=A0A345ULL5_9BACT|nr:hypothetical protein [Cyclonatronum proteinivorum]AXJ01367.1 hypothetical protein CYPRO_2118 [Cyclonatronum proteinivorum]